MLRRPQQFKHAFAHNSVLRGAFEAFAGLRPKHPRGPMSHLHDDACAGATYFQHHKLFADAALLSCKIGALIESAADIASTTDGETDSHRCVAILIKPGYDFFVSLLGVWLAGGIAVPLNVGATKEEMEHLLSSSGCRLVVAEKTSGVVAGTDDTRPHLRIDFASEGKTSLTREHREAVALRLLSSGGSCQSPVDDALIIGTSGTTAKPKLAVHSHLSVSNQVNVLTKAWQFSNKDALLHCLPLHHVHGLINCGCTPISASAHIQFIPKMDASTVVSRISSMSPFPITIFSHVPAAYKRIVGLLEEGPAETSSNFRAALQEQQEPERGRPLFISGSSACPVPLLRRFREQSGSSLLERMGSTEIGMALSQPLLGERVPGTVGKPLPTVEIKASHRIEEDTGVLDLLVRSPSVFSRYWGDKQKTVESFVVEDGKLWFDTGDTVSCESDGTVTILGRASVDILKIAGYKVSSLEVENVLLDTGRLEEVAVFAAGAEEETIALTVPRTHTGMNKDELAKELQQALVERLSSYKRPRVFLWCAALPRNAMGKVNKKQLAKDIEQLKKESEEFAFPK